PASLCQSWPQRRRRPTLLVWQRTPQRVPRGQRGRSSVLPLTGADDAAIGEDRGGVVILARVARGSGGHGEDGGPVGAARGEDIGAGGAAGDGSTAAARVDLSTGAIGPSSTSPVFTAPGVAKFGRKVRRMFPPMVDAAWKPSRPRRIAYTSVVPSSSVGIARSPEPAFSPMFT